MQKGNELNDDQWMRRQHATTKSSAIARERALVLLLERQRHQDDTYMVAGRLVADTYMVAMRDRCTRANAIAPTAADASTTSADSLARHLRGIIFRQP